MQDTFLWHKRWKARDLYFGGGFDNHVQGSIASMDPNTGKVVAKFDMFYLVAGVLATKGG